jgi:alkylhydroperoxidase family enzyme
VFAPVAEPETATGSVGDFWTVLVGLPEVILHARTFANDFVSSDHRELTRAQREVGTVRAAFNVESKFEYSQHRKLLRATGYPDQKANAIPVWVTSSPFGADECAVLALTSDTETPAQLSVLDHMQTTANDHASTSAIPPSVTAMHCIRSFG